MGKARGHPIDSPWTVHGQSMGNSLSTDSACAGLGHPMGRQPVDSPWVVRGIRGQPMAIPRTAHGLSAESAGSPWPSHGQPMVIQRTAYGHPMVIPQAAHGHPMDSKWTTNGQSIGSPLGTDSPWTAHGHPIGNPQAAHRHPMDRSRATHGHPTGSPWASHWAARRQPTGST